MLVGRMGMLAYSHAHAGVLTRACEPTRIRPSVLSSSLLLLFF